MAWDYAELSKAAKEAGGPEKLMDLLVESGRDTGHKEMLPLMGIMLVLGVLGHASVQKVIQYFKKKSVSPEAVEKAKKELIQGINEYDAAHAEQAGVNDDTTDEKTEEDKKE